MPESNHRGESGSHSLITAIDGIAWARKHGALALGFATVLMGETEAPSVTRAAFIRLFRERSQPSAGSDQVQVLMNVRQVCVERGLPQTPKGARWLREVAGCSKATAAAILGVGVADVQTEIRRDLDASSIAIEDAACKDARSDLHDLILDGPTTPRTAAASAHVLVCTRCTDAEHRAKAARLSTHLEAVDPSDFDLLPSDFESVLEGESRVRQRARIIPWIVVAAVALAVLLIWAPWSQRTPTMPGSMPASWWRATVSSPLGGAFSLLRGLHGRPPKANFVIGPSKEFLIETVGFAIVPTKAEDGGGLTTLDRGKIGRVGFDGTEAWWEAGDGIVRRLEEDESRRLVSRALGFADVIERVVRGVESRQLEMVDGTPDMLEGEKVTRYTVHLPGVGDLVPLAKVTVLIGEDGVLRQVSTGIIVARMTRLQVGPNENPCSWKFCLPNATMSEGK